jgi:hypothetical protein
MDVSEENEMNELLKEALEALEEAVGTIEGLDGRDNSCDEKLDLGDFRKTIAKLTAALSSVEAKPVAIPVMPELALAEDFCAPRDWDEDQRRDWSQLQAAATNEGRLRKHALELHALLAAPLASVEAQSRLSEAQWKPIETAPTEGEFLVYMPRETSKIQAARFNSRVRVIGNAFAFDLSHPTHWMPLPAAPVAALSEGSANHG